MKTNKVDSISNISTILSSEVDTVSLLEVARACIDGGALGDTLTSDQLASMAEKLKVDPKYQGIADKWGESEAIITFIDDVNSSSQAISDLIGEDIAYLKVKRIIESNGSTLQEFFTDSKSVKFYSDLIKQHGLPEVGSGWGKFSSVK